MTNYQSQLYLYILCFYRDSIIVAAGDCLTSIFAGVVIFAIIGYMAHELGVPIDQVATQGTIGIELAMEPMILY